jgi:hypothetical protein
MMMHYQLPNPGLLSFDPRPLTGNWWCKSGKFFLSPSFAITKSYEQILLPVILKKEKEDYPGVADEQE